jgi:MoaA/NifB/PqqE/SkfB family radical SAM enzyme
MSTIKLGEQWVDYADVLVDVMIGYACNVQCDYCSITDDMRRENMATAAVIPKLSEARAQGATKVSFGGGEPTIRRSLLPLVRWCRDRGYGSIKIPSNGLMYSYRSYAEEASEAGINLFHISFMAHTAELYEKIMGKPGAFQLVTQGVRNLMALGHKPIGDLIIKSDTWMHLADIVEYWAGLGIDTFNLWLVSLSDRNKDNLASLPRVSDMRDGICAAFERGKQLGVTVHSRHIPRCMLPGYEDHVADLRQDKVLVITPHTTFALWESKISPNTYAEKCRGCRYQHGACLGVRLDYLERYGDAELRPQMGAGPSLEQTPSAA